MWIRIDVPLKLFKLFILLVFLLNQIKSEVKLHFAIAEAFCVLMSLQAHHFKVEQFRL